MPAIGLGSEAEVYVFEVHEDPFKEAAEGVETLAANEGAGEGDVRVGAEGGWGRVVPVVRGPKVDLSAAPGLNLARVVSV